MDGWEVGMKVMERGGCCWITVSEDGVLHCCVLGLTSSRAVYDKSEAMDFYLAHNSEGYRTRCLAARIIWSLTKYCIELNYQPTVEIFQSQTVPVGTFQRNSTKTIVLHTGL